MTGSRCSNALPALPDSNHLVLLEPAPTRDARTALGRSPLLRALRAIEGADVQQFEALRLYGRGPGGNEVAAWLIERAARRGAAIETPAAERLSQLLGADLWALSTELDKLARPRRGPPRRRSRRRSAHHRRARRGCLRAR